MPSSTRPGDLLADRYRLDDLLSESGNGRFWRAHDRVLRRHVALHVMAADDDRVHLLLDAARRSATVSDARVLRVLDAEQSDDMCFVVNEWGYGTSLDIALANNGPLSPRQAAWLVAEVADSLVAAHERGVTHGRLAPENVLIDETGDVRLIGLCVDAALHGLPPGSVRHDLADLGGLLHAALTGRWAGASPSAVGAAPQHQGRTLRPRQVRAGVPRVLDELVDVLVNCGSDPDRLEAPSASDTPDSPGPPDVGEVLEVLAGFVGDPTGIARAMAADNPLPPTDVVVLPQVPDIVLRVSPPPEPVDTSLDASTGAEAGDGSGPTTDAPGAPVPVPDIVGGRPLFAPVGDDAAARKARAERIGRAGPDRTTGGRAAPRTGTGRAALGGDATGTTRAVPREDELDTVTTARVPGRRWLRLAWVVAALLVLFVVVSILTDDTGTPQPADQVVPGLLRPVGLVLGPPG